ncbi:MULTISPECIES: ABC transporter permease [Pseudothermotoga]|uniref:Binding-protein-dependent transport systems inner membrane component n=1 Tax=Pseudothermotoga lettingae (strain ATCC BAA-301 / DSM 14385 / NBRC 107922 / TMO) TaxID=416591 RepID=A8F4X4_PSELT|nr:MULTISPECIES: ABC transporter permease [Pseudothermotoga]ABV33208.1 binding-protein-dependent transport systems inner membrane component [Pseudothermotoga lettingae TMO]MDI3495692.1 peptide/nickel transport system permease protein [Pseudothermotoga sp.]MDK2885357.1 peptide/nickel transport system permease protein [Pseudothermotoga sp.]GLI49875.1 peptide ABC transporter permease [Pseudothermotoga lettingae TMO]
MLKYIGRRLVISIPELLVITMMIFLIMYAAPGDFLDQYRLDPSVSQKQLEAMEEEFGLNKPPVIQYLVWLKNLLKGNLGYSFSYRRPVSDLIWERVAATLILSLISLASSWIFGIALGVFSALKKYSFADKLLTFLAFAFVAIPEFFLGLVMLYFAAKSGWFPISGMKSVYYSSLSTWERFKDILWHLILPATALSLGSFAGLMRYMRGSLLDVLNEDYVTFARAKGMPERVVIFKHAMRNAINPMITFLGFSISGLLGGALFIENVFGWPGMGRLIYQALIQQDMYIVMASGLISAILLVIGNLVADILLALVDPRVRLS